MKLGKDFIFRDDLKTDTVPIQLINSIFEDTVLRYTKVSIKERDKQEAIIQFEYELLELPEEMSEKKLRRNPQFKEHLGLVLNSLILDIVDNTPEAKGHNDHRKDDSQKSIEE